MVFCVFCTYYKLLNINVFLDPLMVIMGPPGFEPGSSGPKPERMDQATPRPLIL